jgi:hypothetical protein
MRTQIRSRQEFEKHLAEAIVKMKKLIQTEGDDPILIAVLRQLEAVEQWTSGDRNLTADEKKRIVMGLQAHRQMQDFPDEQDLVLALHVYIETDMPTAPLPS